MRMGVGATHGCTLVLEDLHVAVLLLGLGDVGVLCDRSNMGGWGVGGQRGGGGQVCGVDLCPGIDHWQDINGRHIGEGDVVTWREGHDIALAGDRLSLEEARFESWHWLVKAFRIGCASVPKGKWSYRQCGWAHKRPVPPSRRCSR